MEVLTAVETLIPVVVVLHLELVRVLGLNAGGPVVVIVLLPHHHTQLTLSDLRARQSQLLVVLVVLLVQPLMQLLQLGLLLLLLQVEVARVLHLTHPADHHLPSNAGG